MNKRIYGIYLAYLDVNMYDRFLRKLNINDLLELVRFRDEI